MQSDLVSEAGAKDAACFRELPRHRLSRISDQVKQKWWT